MTEPENKIVRVLEGIEGELEKRNARPQWMGGLLSTLMGSGLVGLFMFVMQQASMNEELSEKLEAITARVDKTDNYIEKHEPMIEHRDTRQCGYAIMQSLALANLHNALKRYTKGVIDLQDVPLMDCGEGAGQ